MKATHKRLGMEAGPVAHTGRLGWIAGLALLCLLLSIAPLAAAPSSPTAEPVINQVYITDVRDVYFVVSWTTDVASDGYVDWGTTTSLGNTTADSVNSVISTTTHYVELAVQPLTTYYFQVRSEDTIDNNDGAYYSVTTGKILGIAEAGKTINGYVYASGGTTPVPYAIVYIQLQDNNGSGSPGNSQWASARANNVGYWKYTLGNLRVADASGYFEESDGTDNLRLIVQGGDLGCIGENEAEVIVPVPSTYPKEFTYTLDGAPNAVTLTALASQKVAAVSGVGALAMLLGVLVDLLRTKHRKE